MTRPSGGVSGDVVSTDDKNKWNEKLLHHRYCVLTRDYKMYIIVYVEREK